MREIYSNQLTYQENRMSWNKQPNVELQTSRKQRTNQPQGSYEEGNYKDFRRN